MSLNMMGEKESATRCPAYWNKLNHMVNEVDANQRQILGSSSRPAFTNDSRVECRCDANRSEVTVCVIRRIIEECHDPKEAALQKVQTV